MGQSRQRAVLDAGDDGILRDAVELGEVAEGRQECAIVREVVSVRAGQSAVDISTDSDGRRACVPFALREDALDKRVQRAPFSGAERAGSRRFVFHAGADPAGSRPAKA